MNVPHLILDICIDVAFVATIVVLLVRLGRKKARIVYRDMRIKHLLADRKDLAATIVEVCQSHPEVRVASGPIHFNGELLGMVHYFVYANEEDRNRFDIAVFETSVCITSWRDSALEDEET
jgi:hypothetical protein